MRVKITHLKAPWPLGALVGDVLDLPEVPVWAVGKCVQVADDVDVAIDESTQGADNAKAEVDKKATEESAVADKKAKVK